MAAISFKSKEGWQLIEIQIVKGPLSDVQLENVALLYGKVDKKYQSVEFCRYLFNDNPFGYSYHCFAVNDNFAVGHISLIPIYIDTPQKRVVSYKAEAFYIDEHYRSEWVIINNEEVPIGLALPRALYQYAKDIGCELIHLLADDEIGKIHIFAGCNLVPVPVKERFILLNYKEYIKKETKFTKTLLYKLTYFIQSIIYNLSLTVINTVVSDLSYIQRVSGSEADLPELPVHDHYQWTISQTEEYYRWFYQSPYIKIYYSIKDPETYFIVKEGENPGRATEIIHVNIRESRIRTLSRVMYSIISIAKKNKSSCIVYKQFNHNQIPASLASTFSVFGFLQKRSVLNCYVKTEDVYYLFIENFVYNQLFYVQF